MIGQFPLLELVPSRPPDPASALYACRVSFFVFRGFLEYAVSRLAQTLASQRVCGFPRNDPRFLSLIAVAACSQTVDVYHVKSRRL
jgi:hypothetical protein